MDDLDVALPAVRSLLYQLLACGFRIHMTPSQVFLLEESLLAFGRAIIDEGRGLAEEDAMTLASDCVERLKRDWIDGGLN